MQQQKETNLYNQTGMQLGLNVNTEAQEMFMECFVKSKYKNTQKHKNKLSYIMLRK